MVERFEAFAGGMEIANAFSELNDPDDQRERFAEQARGTGPPATTRPQPIDEDFLARWSTACRRPAASAWASTAW